MLVRHSFSLFTSLYKNITNDLAILRVLVAQGIRASVGCAEGRRFESRHGLKLKLKSKAKIVIIVFMWILKLHGTQVNPSAGLSKEFSIC